MIHNRPHDATGDALRRWAKEGSDLSRPMNIDFFVAVPSENIGQQISRRAQTLGFSVSLELDAETGMWTCYCTILLLPEYSEITKSELLLDSIAKEYGGHVDGFGELAPGKRLS